MNMKRSKVNGKYFLKKTSDEQKKTRDSILEVFQSHLKSATRADKISTRPFTYPVEQSQCNDSNTSSDIMSDTDNTPQKHNFKTKRKKRRSERNKSKAYFKGLTSTRTSVQQHMSAAHNASKKELENRGQRQTGTCITQNRLTTKLGMFNKGKKSSTIARVPIKVPDSVREKTREDLKKILNISDAEPDVSYEQQSWKNEKENLLQDYGGRGSSGGVSSTVTSYSDSHRPVLTPLSANSSGSKIKYAHSASSCTVSCSPTPYLPPKEDFPESPPLEAIAKSLQLELKPSRWFPGMGYLQELEEELNKLMKQNAPDHHNVTPMRTTPGSVKSETVKRSLLKSLLSLDCDTGIGTSHHVTHQSNTKMDVDLLDTSSQQCLAVDHNQNVEHIPCVLDDHKSWHHQNPDYNQNFVSHNTGNTQPQAMQMESTVPSDIPDVDTYFDARKLLSHNDSMIASRTQSSDLNELNNPHETAEMLGACCQQLVCSQSSQSSGYYSHRAIPGLAKSGVQTYEKKAEDWQLTTTKQAVVTQLNEHPEYMPRFHGDYFKDQLERWTEVSREQDPALDILEMVDRGVTAGVLSSAARVGSTRGVVEQGTPESDRSPLFLPGSLILPLKPSLDTPSPPDKLYPRKLY